MRSGDSPPEHLLDGRGILQQVSGVLRATLLRLPFPASFWMAAVPRVGALWSTLRVSGAVLADSRRASALPAVCRERKSGSVVLLPTNKAVLRCYCPICSPGC